MWNNWNSSYSWMPAEDFRLPKTHAKLHIKLSGKGNKKIKIQSKWDRSCISKRKKSFHTLRNPRTCGDKNEPQNIRAKHSNKYVEDKAGRIWQKDQCRVALPSWEAVCTPNAASGAGCWGSGFRGRTPGRRLGLTAMEISEGAGTTQLRESRERPGPAKGSRVHCPKEPLTRWAL